MDTAAYLASIQAQIDSTQLTIDAHTQRKADLEELKLLLETDADALRVVELTKSLGLL